MTSYWYRNPYEATLNEQPARARPTAYDEAIAMTNLRTFRRGGDASD